MKKAKNVKPVVLDSNPSEMLNNADAFKKISDDFIKTYKDQPDQLIKTLSSLIAAATNLGLALELYLKALLMIVKHNDVPRHHHLWNLFAYLPQDLQNSIRDNYDKNSDNPSYLGSFVLEAHKSDTPRDSEVTKGKLETTGRDLDSILKISSQMFETWRYIHESAMKGKPTLYRFHYGSVNLICDTVRYHVLELVKLIEAKQTKPDTSLG